MLCMPMITWAQTNWDSCTSRLARVIEALWNTCQRVGTATWRSRRSTSNFSAPTSASMAAISSGSLMNARARVSLREAGMERLWPGA